MCNMEDEKCMACGEPGAVMGDPWTMFSTGRRWFLCEDREACIKRQSEAYKDWSGSF